MGGSQMAERAINGIELTPQQNKQWEDTMSLMAWTAPGFRHLFYKLLSNNNGKYVAIPTKDVPIAATDAKNIMINPDTFFAYPLKQRVFIMAHEIVHNMYSDVELLHRCKNAGLVPTNSGKDLPFKMDAMQHAMDFRINAMLKDSRIGEAPPDCLLDAQHKAMDSVLDIYERIYEDYPEGGGGPGGGFDQVLPPGTSTGQDPNNHNRNAQQWAVETETARMLEEMRSKGDMPGALKRLFKELLDPEVSWTEHIRTLVQRRTGSGVYSWRKPDRRHITRDLFMPSRSGFGAGVIDVWGDTSGSIGGSELCAYLSEFKGILEDVRPQLIRVHWCDAALQRIDEIRDAGDLDECLRQGAPGGGGTSVMPVFDAIAEHTEPTELFIGFTDLYVSLPAIAPRYPVIWACTTDQEPAWGEVVRINKRAQEKARAQP